MPQNFEDRWNENDRLNTALYIRLSREDGDRAESLSVANQRLLLTEFLKRQDDLSLYDLYIDDGFTGTNFERPAFMQMMEDIKSRKIQCVIVKDLSRLGRNLPRVSEYINEYFPREKVRFISINDMIDKRYYDFDTNRDMAIDFKNMFNGFYPRDIAGKVRSTFRSKQGDGQFIGAFASYGYRKSPDDHNRLVIDETAAEVVRRIYQMYIGGVGQIAIAKKLNEEGVSCPSEYKKQCGLNYHNGNRLDATSYWTYSTVHRILKNEMYIGSMVQNKSFRQVCKKNAVSLPRDKWIVVENTHQPIIDRDTWNQVQNLLKRNVRQTRLTGSMHLFAGFLRCGDCKRAMVKIVRRGTAVFNCGSYNRYGNRYCSIHGITEAELERIVLEDLNLIIRSAKNIRCLIEEEKKKQKKERSGFPGDTSMYQSEISRFTKKKEKAYEDYSDGLITKADYLEYRKKYEDRIEVLQSKIDIIHRTVEAESEKQNPWIERLLWHEQLDCLDRETVAEMVSVIYVYADNTIKIVYNFSDELEALLHQPSITVGERGHGQNSGDSEKA